MWYQGTSKPEHEWTQVFSTMYWWGSLWGLSSAVKYVDTWLCSSGWLIHACANYFKYLRQLQNIYSFPWKVTLFLPLDIGCSNNNEDGSVKLWRPSCFWLFEISQWSASRERRSHTPSCQYVSRKRYLKKHLILFIYIPVFLTWFSSHKSVSLQIHVTNTKSQVTSFWIEPKAVGQISSA